VKCAKYRKGKGGFTVKKINSNMYFNMDFTLYKDAHTDNMWLSSFPECTKKKLQKTTVTLFLKSFCYSVNQQEIQNLES
jgi:hypothetical protein